MRIGLYTAAADAETTEAIFREAAADGLDSVWVTQGFGTDALVMIAALARHTSRLRIGTAVVPTYPRHPMVLAQQALTTNLLIDGRLTLGVGPSHPDVVEACWGMSYDKPARHTREYVTALSAALEQHVRFRGETITARGDLDIPGATVPRVLVSALGPRMIEIAGSLADGTITWMVGPRTLATDVVPGIRAAAESSGRERPEVVVAVPVCVTSRPERARDTAAANLAWYSTQPSYRSVLAREGVHGPEDIALIGTRDEVYDAFGRYRDLGVTTLAAQVFGADADETAATRAFVADAARDT